MNHQIALCLYTHYRKHNINKFYCIVFSFVIDAEIQFLCVVLYEFLTHYGFELARTFCVEPSVLSAVVKTRFAIMPVQTLHCTLSVCESTLSNLPEQFVILF